MTTPLDLKKLKVRPLAERKSLTKADAILVAPDAPLRSLPDAVKPVIADCTPPKERSRGMALIGVAFGIARAGERHLLAVDQEIAGHATQHAKQRQEEFPLSLAVGRSLYRLS